MKDELNFFLVKLSENLNLLNFKISSTESVTGGKFAHYLTYFKNSSNFFDSSLIVYSKNAKENLLHLDSKRMNDYGTVSKEIANDMVESLFNLTKSNVCVSFTGNSGPKPIENKPIGLCYIGLKITNFKDFNYKEIFKFSSKNIDRQDIIDELIVFTFKKIIDILRKI